MTVNNAHQGFVVGDGKWPGRCSECGTSFEGIRPNMTLCHNCWYLGELAEAEKDFALLSTVLQAAGLRTEVLQTGGMVMCLAGYPTDAPLPYFMWGDPAEFEDPSFTVYIQGEDTEQDLYVRVYDYAQLPAALARKDEWIALANDPNTEEVTA